MEIRRGAGTPTPPPSPRLREGTLGAEAGSARGARPLAPQEGEPGTPPRTAQEMDLGPVPGTWHSPLPSPLGTVEVRTWQGGARSMKGVLSGLTPRGKLLL